MFVKNFNTYFFFLLLLGVTVAGFLLIKPFLGAIFIAALLAIIFMKPYRFLEKKLKNATAASLIMLILITVIIILPIIFTGILVIGEVSDTVEVATNNSTLQETVQTVISSIVDLPVVGFAMEKSEVSIESIDFGAITQKIANYSLKFIQSFYKSVVNGTVATFVMFFTLFYFFVDGKKLVHKIMDLSPMKNKYEQELINEFTSMTRATLKGTIVIGVIQGTLGGIALAIAGVASPILWTVIMIILGVIPAVGAGLVIFPIAIVLLLLGSVWQGIFLIVVGLFVSTIDNFLRPKLVGNDVQMHSLAVFFATLGGLKIFGIMGFIIGPIIMALMIAMWEIYASEFKVQLEKFNV